jgi:hypothetical protein
VGGNNVKYKYIIVDDRRLKKRLNVGIDTRHVVGMG